MLSRSVGRIMSAYYGPEMAETSKFFQLVDRFFDCLNGRSLHEAIRTRKPDLAPYKQADDPRFEVLIKTKSHSNTMSMMSTHRLYSLSPIYLYCTISSIFINTSGFKQCSFNSMKILSYIIMMIFFKFWPRRNISWYTNHNFVISSSFWEANSWTISVTGRPQSQQGQDLQSRRETRWSFHIRQLKESSWQVSQFTDNKLVDYSYIKTIIHTYLYILYILRRNESPGVNIL